MARFTAFQAGQLWAKSLGNPGTTKAELLYVLDTEAGILCEDGTIVYLKGTGFTYITGTDGLPHLSGGKVTAVSHFDAVGHNISETTGITGTDGTGASLYFGRYAILKQDAQSSVSYLEYNAMSGNDIMDARTRADGAIVNDQLNGWGGNDTIYAGTGNDSVSGDDGNDYLFGDAGDDRIAGGRGDDRLYGSAGVDLLAGGSGNDRLDGGTGVDTAFYLGKFSDLNIVKTTSGFTVSSGENGTDTLFNIERISTNDGVYAYNAVSQTWLRTGNANPSLMLSDTAAVENGSAGADSFASGFANSGVQQTSLDLIFGGAGNDTYDFTAAFGFDSIRHDHGLLYGYGGAGDDSFSVQFVTDYLLTAAQGTFRFFGETGNDTLTGGRGNDELDGGTGADTLNGGNGNDVMTGGADSDVFVFSNVYPSTPRSATISSGNDTITDFVVGVDHLKYSSNTTFTVADTTDGILVTALTSTPPGGITSTVLLQGVHGTIAMGDLLLA